MGSTHYALQTTYHRMISSHVVACCRQKLWQTSLCDASLYLDFNRSRVFAALTNGTVAVLEIDQDGALSSDVYYVPVSEQPISCMSAGICKEQLWCAAANTINIFHMRSMDKMDSFQVSKQTTDHVSDMKLGIRGSEPYGMWISIRGRAVIELWDVHTLTCKLLYNVVWNRPIRSIMELEYSEMWVTSILPLEELLWVGTSHGQLVVYEVSAMVSDTSSTTSSNNTSDGIESSPLRQRRQWPDDTKQPLIGENKEFHEEEQGQIIKNNVTDATHTKNKYTSKVDIVITSADNTYGIDTEEKDSIEQGCVGYMKTGLKRSKAVSLSQLPEMEKRVLTQRSKAMSLPEHEDMSKCGYNFISKQSRMSVKQLCERFQLPAGSNKEKCDVVIVSKDVRGKPRYPSMGLAARHRHCSSRSSSTSETGRMNDDDVQQKDNQGGTTQRQHMTRSRSLPNKLYQAIGAESGKSGNEKANLVKNKKRHASGTSTTHFSSSVDDSFEYDDVFIPYSEEDKVVKLNINKGHSRSLSMFSLASATALDNKLVKSNELAFNAMQLTPNFEMSDSELNPLQQVDNVGVPASKHVKTSHCFLFVNKDLHNNEDQNTSTKSVTTTTSAIQVPLIIHCSESGSEGYPSDAELYKKRPRKMKHSASTGAISRGDRVMALSDTYRAINRPTPTSSAENMATTPVITSTHDSGGDISNDETDEGHAMSRNAEQSSASRLSKRLVDVVVTQEMEHEQTLTEGEEKQGKSKMSIPIGFSCDLTLQQSAKISSRPVRCLVVDQRLSVTDDGSAREQSFAVISCSGSLRDPEPVLKWERLIEENVWSNEPVYEVCPRTNEVKLKQQYLPRVVQEQCVRRLLERWQSVRVEPVETSIQQPSLDEEDSDGAQLRKGSASSIVSNSNRTTSTSSTSATSHGDSGVSCSR